MDLKHAICHQILKERQHLSSLKTRGDEWPIEKEQVTSLAAEVRDLYATKATKHYGAFETDEVNYPFQMLLKRHLSGKLDFVTFTKAALSHLKARIDTKPLATGGYVIFFLYTHNGEKFLQVVMLDDATGSAIDASLNVKRTTHLNLEKLHLGGRINITRWKSGEKSYLSFIKGRSAEVSEYFRLFLGCTDYTTAKEGTGKLVAAVKAFCNDKNFSKEQKHAFEQRVFSFCEEKHRLKETVSLSALSAFLNPEEPEVFFEFANNAPYEVDIVITPDKGTYKRLQYISYKGEFSISFPSEYVGKSITYDSEKGSLLIEQLPDDLKAQLEQI